MGWPLQLPAGTKRSVTEASVLRGFARNIELAAHLPGAAARPYRLAYYDALRRARQAELRARGE